MAVAKTVGLLIATALAEIPVPESLDTPMGG